METLIDSLRAIVGAAHCLAERDELIPYECDGLTLHGETPSAVVLPRDTDEVARVVRACRRFGVPFVPRGAGTGLSGGAIAMEGGVVIECSRLDRVLAVHLEDRIAVVQPIANPIEGDWVRMTNRDWAFSIQEAQRQLDLTTLLVVNNFTALAMSLPRVGADGRHQVGGGAVRVQPCDLVPASQREARDQPATGTKVNGRPDDHRAGRRSPISGDASPSAAAMIASSGGGRT